MSEPTIRPITKEELYEYFRFMNNEGTNHGWPKEQAVLISDAMEQSESWRLLIAKIMLLIPQIGLTSALASTLITGFQCGREFENRLMARAIREGK